jgi:hypothetical protein
MAIYGNGVTISVNGSGEMVITTASGNVMVYNFTHGTMLQPNKVYAQITGGFGQDAGGQGQNYLDPATVNNSSGTFTFTGGRFTCPKTGAYRMTASCLCRTNWHHWGARNDGQMFTGAHNTGPSGYNSLGWSWIAYANAGDTLSFRGNQNSGTIWGSTWSQYTIEYIG